MSAPVDARLVRAHGYAALVGLVLAAVFGLIVASKLVDPSLLSGAAALTWGRARIGHTQTLFFGWFGNAFFAMLYFLVPRLAAEPVKSSRLGWTMFVVWNGVVVVPGVFLVLAGVHQPLEWAEFPWFIDCVVVLALALAVVQFVSPFAGTHLRHIYVSSWYIIAGLVFTLFAYPMGNLVPEMLPGGLGAAFSGLWTHDAVGLFVTPMVLAVAYYVIPAVTRKPIFSHFISLIGFWLLLFVYPLNGTHHYLWSPLPMDAQKGAVLASLYLGANVVLVVANLFASLRGSAARVASDVSLRFVFTGIVAYCLVSIQGASQAVMPFNRIVHFTDWVIGHSHLAMVGFASFTVMGGLFHAFRHTPGAKTNASAANVAYWLCAVGLALMVADLTIAGIVQGELARRGAPIVDGVLASRPYWIVRAVSGVLLLVGFASFCISLTTGKVTTLHIARELDVGLEGEPSVLTPRGESTDVSHGPHGSAAALVYGILFAAGFVSFGLSFVALGVLPAREMLAAMRDDAEVTPTATAAEQRGRGIYIREGCGYCHTQQVRSLDEDVRRYGAPTAAWETAHDAPHLWGTRRIGPDLSRESGVHPNDWHFAHLWHPADVAPLSVMPAFPWLFGRDATEPTSEARDLVAFLQSLGKAKRDRSERTVVDGTRASGRMKMPVGCACRELDPDPPRIAVSTAAPDIVLGRQAFVDRCAGCHGSHARGDGPAAVALSPRPADLTAARFDADRLSNVLWNGVPRTAMPRFRDVSLVELRGLVAYVASIGPPLLDIEEVSPSTDAGRRLFTIRCAACHGATGRGDGPAESLLGRLPTDFTTKQPARARFDDVVLNGVSGTAMVPVAQHLVPRERDALFAYVISRFGAREATR